MTKQLGRVKKPEIKGNHFGLFYSTINWSKRAKQFEAKDDHPYIFQGFNLYRDMKF